MTSNQGGANGPESARQSAAVADDLKTCSDPHFIRWPWSSVLVARVAAPCADEGLSAGADRRLLFLAPTALGLEALEKSELAIANIWLLARSKDEALGAVQIDRITSWSTLTPAGRHLTVLCARNGAYFAIEDEHFLDLTPISTDWPGSGTYRQRWSADSAVNDGAVETSVS